MNMKLYFLCKLKVKKCRLLQYALSISALTIEEEGKFVHLCHFLRVFDVNLPNM